MVKRLSKDFLDQYKDRAVPWGPLGYVVYKRTYARIKENGQLEEWWETVQRCVEWIVNFNPYAFSTQEMYDLYYIIFNLKACFSGRSLWQLGTDTVNRVGADSLQSCWSVAVDSPIEPFCFTFNQLMLGGGVGFNITPYFVYALPKIKYNPTVERVETNDCDYIVTDNREGWVTLLGKVLKSFFFTGKPLRYSTSCIRARGKKIQSFGGIASGSEELVKGIDKIVQILKKNYLSKLTPVDCLDIMNIIGSIVVSGNVRRSAQIAIGDPSDHEFITAKNWNLKTIPNWRSMSNNSVNCSSVEQLGMEFWDSFSGNGEPYGIINLENAKKYGRIGVEANDHGVIGTNPCGEITLESYEPCNLVELFLPNIYDNKELYDVARLMYKVAKVITTIPCSYSKTQDVVSRNRRIGISASGIMQSRFSPFNLSKLYERLVFEDESFSKTLGINTSKKLTTIKPSGTLSLLAGVSPGIHPEFAPYYVRRIRMASNDELVEKCKDAGYKIEPQYLMDGTKDPNTMIINFPIKARPGSIVKSQVDCLHQLEALADYQQMWSDNSISITVYYRKEDIYNIKNWLQHNLHTIKSVSFLLEEDHGFAQPPLEEITEEEYVESIKDVRPITNIATSEELNDVDCEKGGCPIK